MQEQLPNKAKNLAGMRFGKLTVLRYVGKDGRGYPAWRCRCDCGNEIDVARPSLTSSKGRKSCGCLSARKPPLDLAGKRFGMLTALELLDERKGGSAVWKCLCDCGGEAAARAGELTSGKKTHCGCQRKAGRPRLDLSGKRFGMLAALEPCGKDRHGNHLWRCLCDCGRETAVRASQLTAGKTRSCGCASKRARM